jgi:hypothetical protein
LRVLWRWPGWQYQYSPFLLSFRSSPLERTTYLRFVVGGIEPVNNRDAYILIAVPRGGDTPKRLYFDTHFSRCRFAFPVLAQALETGRVQRR